MRYPLTAPLMLSIAGLGILMGTVAPADYAHVCFTWIVPLAFLGLTLCMQAASNWRIDVPSSLLLVGSLLSLQPGLCASAASLCGSSTLVPPIVPALLAVSGPALLIAKYGADTDPILLCWLGSTIIGLIPALPVEYQDILWQPGVVSPLLLFTQALLMVRTRWRVDDAPAISKSKQE